MRFAAVFVGALLASAVSLTTAQAATQQKFDQGQFAAARADGRPVVVFIEASWCPTCAKERPILAELMNDPAFKDLIILDVDFDTQKDVVRAMGATMQSTPVAFHGKDERGRMVGESGAEQRRLPGSLPPPGERLSLSSTAPPMMRILSTSRSGTQSDARS